jgi:hypothetical protein
MLSIIYAECHDEALILSFVMLNVMLTVVILSVITPNAVAPH